LATCSDSTNLQIYDLQGNLKSSHAWPNVGKTLAVVGLRNTQQLLVFTEKRVFVVMPTVDEVASSNPPATATIPPKTKTPATKAPAPPKPATPPPPSNDGARHPTVAITNKAEEVSREPVHHDTTKLPNASVTEISSDSELWAWGPGNDVVYTVL